MSSNLHNESNRKRILVYHAGTLGDTIVALPSFWVVREYFSDAHLTLFSSYHFGTKYVAPTEVLPKKGLFDEYISYPASISGTNPKDLLLKMVPSLRKGRFNMLVYLAPSRRERWRIWRDLLFFRMAGINKFIGHYRFEDLSRRIRGKPLPLVMHEADRLLKRLAYAGIPVPPPGEGCMSLALTAEESIEAHKWLKFHIGINDKLLLVGINPSSKWPSKIWPEERYNAVIHKLIREFNIFPIIFGGEGEEAVGERLIAECGIGVNIAGKLSPRQSAAILSFCRLFIGNDTGTMHLAVAVNTPCVAIFSAQDWPGKWYPYRGKNIVIRKIVPCEGCCSPQCPTGTLECLKQISVDEVLSACKQLLSS